MVKPTVDPHGSPTVKPGTVPSSRAGKVVEVVVDAVLVEASVVVVARRVVVVAGIGATRADGADSRMTANATAPTMEPSKTTTTAMVRNRSGGGESGVNALHKVGRP